MLDSVQSKHVKLIASFQSASNFLERIRTASALISYTQQLFDDLHYDAVGHAELTLEHMDDLKLNECTILREQINKLKTQTARADAIDTVSYTHLTLPTTPYV